MYSLQSPHGLTFNVNVELPQFFIIQIDHDTLRNIHFYLSWVYDTFECARIV